MKYSSTQKFKSWIAVIRANRPYQLADDLEKILHEKSITGRASWSRLFDETMASMKFKLVLGKTIRKLGNKIININAIINIIFIYIPKLKRKNVIH